MRSKARIALHKAGYTDEEIDYMWWYCIQKKHKVITKIQSVDVLNQSAALTIPREFKKLGGSITEENIKRWKILIKN